MTNAELITFYHKAQRVIRRRTSHQEFHDDFPAYAVERKLQSSAATWGHILSDYFRYCADGVGRSQKRQATEIFSYDDGREPVPCTTEQDVFAAEVWRGVAFLIKGRPREVLVRHYLNDESLADIGMSLGLTESRTHQILKRAISKLKRHTSRFT